MVSQDALLSGPRRWTGLAAVVPAVGVALLPKCPICLAAYLGVLAPTVAVLVGHRPLLFGVSLVAFGVLARRGQRQKDTPRPKPIRPCCLPS